MGWGAIGVDVGDARSENMAIEIMMTGQALIDALGNVAVELDEDNFATNAATVRKAAAEIDRLTARLQTAERRIRSLARLVLRTG